MAISGNLRTMHFPDLVQWISMSRKTGTLVIKGQSCTKKILFQDGTVAAVTSNDPREHLGYFLVGWRYLTEDELQGFLEKQREARVMLGELLVRSGRLAQDDVDRVIRIKTEQTIYDLMLWEEGEFYFLDEVSSRRGRREVDLPVDHFIFEGARQADERRNIREAIPDTSFVPSLRHALDVTKLNDAARVVVAEIDGTKSIEQIGLATRMPEFEVLSFIYQGLKAGAFSLGPGSGGGAPLPGSSFLSWHSVLLEAENALSLGDLLEAYRALRRLREEYPQADAAQQSAAQIERQIENEVADMQLRADVFLDLAVPFQEITTLKCTPEEAFVLSRVNGVYSLPQVLNQLPGPVLYNLLIIRSFIERGVIKLRESTAIARTRERTVGA